MPLLFPPVERKSWCFRVRHENSTKNRASFKAADSQLQMLMRLDALY